MSMLRRVVNIWFSPSYPQYIGSSLEFLINMLMVNNVNFMNGDMVWGSQNEVES